MIWSTFVVHFVLSTFRIWHKNHSQWLNREKKNKLVDTRPAKGEYIISKWVELKNCGERRFESYEPNWFSPNTHYSHRRGLWQHYHCCSVCTFIRFAHTKKKIIKCNDLYVFVSRINSCHKNALPISIAEIDLAVSICMCIGGHMRSMTLGDAIIFQIINRSFIFVCIWMWSSS